MSFILLVSHTKNEISREKKLKTCYLSTKERKHLRGFNDVDSVTQIVRH